MLRAAAAAAAASSSAAAARRAGAAVAPQVSAGALRSTSYLELRVHNGPLFGCLGLGVLDFRVCQHSCSVGDCRVSVWLGVVYTPLLQTPGFKQNSVGRETWGGGGRKWNYKPETKLVEPRWGLKGWNGVLNPMG